MSDTPDKQLYIVTWADYMVVLADSPEDAASLAHRNRIDLDPDIDEVTDFDHFPPGWDGESRPHARNGASPGDLRHHIEAGKAPQYNARIADIANATGFGRKEPTT